MKIAYVPALALGCVLFSAQGALALPPVDVSSAETIAKRLETLVNGYLASGLRFDGELTPSGAITVTPAGDHYDLAFPSYSAKLPDGRVDLPASTGTLTPADGEVYAFTLDLPENVFTAYDIAGAAIMTMTVGDDTIAGTWDPEDTLVTSMTAHLSNTLIKQKNEGFSAGIRGLDIKLDNSVDASNKMSSQADVNFSDINVIVKDITLSIGEIASNSQSKGVDAEALQRTKQIIRGANPGEAEYKEMLGTLSSLGGQSSSRFEIRDLLLNMQSNTLSSQSKVSLSRAFFETEGRSLDGDKGLAKITVEFGHEGFSMNPPSSRSMAAITPVTSRVAFEIDNFPARDLLQQVGNMALAVTDEDSAALLASLKGIFTEAGTKLVINDVAMRAPDISMTLGGAVEPDMDSPYGAVAKFGARLIGIDELVEKLGKIAQESNNSAADRDLTASGLLMSFGMAQMQGRPVENKVPSERTYDFELTKAGGFLLNGVDLGFVRQLNKAHAPQQPQQDKQPEVNLPEMPR